MKNFKEKAKNIKIIFFDIDDTLRDLASGVIPESVKLAFQELRQKGILTGIATGRDFYGVIPEVRALNPDYYVTANGAYVLKSSGEMVYDQHLDPELVEKIVTWLKSQDSDYIFYGPDKVVSNNWSDLIADAIIPIYGKLELAPDYYLTHSVYQVVSLSDHDKSLVLPADLSDKVRMVRWHEHSSDIVPMSGSKAEGVAKVLETLGWTAENAMNFGDGLNDLELFDFAGLSVALKESHPDVLAKADYVTTSLLDDGVYKALKYLEII